MTEIILIRHGQASFGAANYDALSDLGRAQARALGGHFARLGLRPSRLICGTLSRQVDTAAELRAGMIDAGADWAETAWPETETHAGLNEYDAESMAEAWWKAGERPHPSDRKAHFRGLMQALAAWQAAEIDPVESWAQFSARIADAMALAAARRAGEGADAGAGADSGPVFVATSGGVIGEIIRSALAAPDATWIKVHMQVKNAGYSRLIAGRQGLSVASFNETPHLDGRDGAVTYS